MKTKILIGLILTMAALLLTGCRNEEELWGTGEFVAAFKNPSENMGALQSETEIEIVFSEAAPADGYTDIVFQSDQLLYGVENDFVTDPMAQNGIIRVPIRKGSLSAIFSVSRLTQVMSDEEKSVEFSISEIGMPGKTTRIQGNSSLLLSFSETASLGGTVSPQVGGPNQPNQVYFELRTQKETVIRRDVWDLGFYSGAEWRVKLNSSMFMFAGKLSSTDISQISADEVQALKSKMKFLVDGSNIYVDDPSGSITGTAISEISENDQENHVYLLKLGNEIGTDTPEPGGVAVAGAERGYLKIRILRRNGGYLLQYAEPEAADYQQSFIPRTEGYNFSFFSFSTSDTVSVEPGSDRWDLNFTVKTGVEQLPGAGLTAYGYSDFVETNPIGGVTAYRVSTDEISYQDFSSSDIDDSRFEADQQTIGTSWRKVTPPDKYVYDNIFYILRDAEGNYYKLKFTALENEDGIRGYPQFKYDLIQ